MNGLEAGGGVMEVTRIFYMYKRSSSICTNNLPSSSSLALIFPMKVPFGEFSATVNRYSDNENTGTLSLLLTISTIISAVDVICGIPVSVTYAFT